MALNGKTAIITGVAQGIGKETALLLAERGIARLILLDRDKEGLDEVARELSERGITVSCCTVDLSSREELRRQLGESIQRMGGGIDILVNNAGVANENEPDDEATWDKVIGINLNGTFTVTAVCLPALMIGGRIVNVSSILGRAGNIRNTAYCASKHGLLGYTKALAMDLAIRKITVNAILPGWIDTPMLQRELAAQAEKIGADLNQILRHARKKIPLRRFIGAREAAELIGFLVSDQAAGMTAQSFTIDGGYTCGM